MVTRWDLHIWSLDEDYIDWLCDKYDINWYDADLTDIFENYSYYEQRWSISARITNFIIERVLREIVYKEVDDEDDREKLIESIYTNCIDSWFDISPANDLKTKQARDFVRNF